jgi:steroid delta-isomerase-like uncharacterized protein
VTREDIVALVTRRQQAIEGRDAAALASLYAETCVVESPTAGGPVTGRAAIVQLFQTFFVHAFPDSVATFEDPIIDGDRVTQLLNLAGTGSGSFLGLPPTGKPYRITMVLMTTVKDHHFVHERRIYDFTGLLVQIGGFKAKPV